MHKSISNIVLVAITIKVLISGSCSIGLAMCFIATVANIIHRRIINSQATSTALENDVSIQLASISQKTEELESKINPLILQSGMKSIRQ